MINQEPLNLHVIIKQGITWYTLETEKKEYKLMYIHIL